MDAAWFKAKTAGIPRWAWIAGLGGAVLVGLYLRSRNSTNEEEEYGMEEPVEGAEYAEGGTGEGGLAGAGGFGIGSGGNTTTPVQTPYIPEGFTEMFGQLTELVGRQNEENSQLAAALAAGGGGAPQSGNHEPLFTGPEAAPYTEPKPQPTAPSKPQCPPSVRSKIQNNQDEMQRIQGEINNLQSEISTLTSNIQAHPKASNRGSWESQRNQDQTNIASKRAKVSSLSDENGRLRQTAGCS